MRFFLALSLGALAGCPAPVSETPDRDAGFVPVDAGCPVRCPAGQELCGCECVYVESDREHCGTCDNACEPGGNDNHVGWTCNQGECSCNTQDEPSLCDGSETSTCCNDRFLGVACFDLTSSLDHCGECSNTCDQFVLHPPKGESNPGVSDHCESSVCVCGDLDHACGGTLQSTCCMDDVGGTADPATARCANLLSGGSETETNENDCGDCNIKCPADVGAPNGDRCRNGQCVCGPGTPEVPAVPCPAGQICCGTGDVAACAPVGSCG